MATFDLEKALDQLDGDSEMLSTLVGTFRRILPDQMAQIRSAILELDRERLKSTAHCFKASLGVFAAAPATELVHRLETCAQEADFQTAAETVQDLEDACLLLKTDLTNYASTLK